MVLIPPANDLNHQTFCTRDVLQISASSHIITLTHQALTPKIEKYPLITATKYDTFYFRLSGSTVLFFLLHTSVVILAPNPRKSGQIANKGFMIFYGRYRSQLAILKSHKQKTHVQFFLIDE